MLDWLMPQMMSRIVTVCHTVSHNVHKFTLDVTYVQIGVQLVTKVCYYLEFSYIYKQLIINKKSPLLNCRRLYIWCTYNKLNNNNLRCFIILWQNRGISEILGEEDSSLLTACSAEVLPGVLFVRGV